MNINKSISKFLKENDITIEFITGINGRFNPTTNTISLGVNMPEDEQIPTLLHEIGHFIDVQKRGNAVLKTYYCYNCGIVNNQILQAVYESEINAWNNGLELAKSLGVKIDLHNYYRIMYSSLNTYQYIGERSVA